MPHGPCFLLPANLEVVFWSASCQQSALECDDEVAVFQPLGAKCSPSSTAQPGDVSCESAHCPAAKCDTIMAQQRNRGKKRVVFTILCI